MAVKLDKNTHAYSEGDKKLLGVSEILQLAGIVQLGHIPQANLDNAADRGTDVHLACEDLDKGRPDWWSNDPLVVPHVKAYQCWKTAVDFQPDLIEAIVASPIHEFAGTIDRTGTIRGEKGKRINVIVDLKSGVTFYPWVRLQLAGYAVLLLDPTKWVRIALQLKADGTFDLKQYEDSYRDVMTFMSALTVAKWKIANGINR